MLKYLFDKDFDRYFAACSGGDPLWLFVHVPKTAGSSLTAEAERILQPSFNIDIDHTDATRTYQARFDAAVDNFVARHAGTHYRFATGHINARHVETIRSGVGSLRCFTMLRQPIARLVSDYNYQRSPMNTARAQFIATTPDLETYVARRHVHNKIARSLAPPALVEAGDVKGCVAHIMNAYAFVGLQEMYPLSLRTLTTLMGKPRSPEAKVRVNTESGDKKLLPEMEDRLRDLNAVDVGVFLAFRERWLPIREDLRAYLANRKHVLL